MKSVNFNGEAFEEAEAEIQVAKDDFYDFVCACYEDKDPQEIKRIVDIAISTNEADLYQDQFSLLNRVSELMRSVENPIAGAKAPAFRELSDKERALKMGVWKKPNNQTSHAKVEKRSIRAQQSYRQRNHVWYDNTNTKSKSKSKSKTNEWGMMDEEIEYLTDAFPHIEKSRILSAYHENNRDLFLVAEFLASLPKRSGAPKTQNRNTPIAWKAEENTDPKAASSAPKTVVGLPPHMIRQQKVPKTKAKSKAKSKPKTASKSETEQHFDDSSNSISTIIPLTTNEHESKDHNDSRSQNQKQGQKQLKAELESFTQRQQAIIDLLCEMFGDLDLGKIKEISTKAESVEDAANRMLSYLDSKGKTNPSTKKKKWAKLDDTYLDILATPVGPDSSTNFYKQMSLPVPNLTFKPRISTEFSPSTGSSSGLHLNRSTSTQFRLKDTGDDLEIEDEIEGEKKKMELTEDARQYVLSHQVYDERWKQYIESNLAKRNHCFERSHSSFMKRRNVGMSSGICAFYSEQGWLHDAKVKTWRIREAYGVVEKTKRQASDEFFIDLHGLRLAEAVLIIRNELRLWFKKQTDLYTKPMHELKIVTGVGSHSSRGRPVLFPVIQRILTTDSWKFKTSNGVIFVYGKE